MTRILLLATGAGLVALAGISAWPVLASDNDRSRDRDDRAMAQAVPAEQWLSVSAVAQKLEAMGYTVREIDRERNVYEVEVTDANGLRLEAHVDPRTGDIVGQDDD